jgi:hypothetical protein
MSEDVYPINIWINEERFAKLQEAGLSGMTRDVLAGLKVIQVPTNAAQRDSFLARFPGSKCDTATTKTIELLPRAAKDKLLDLMIQKRDVNVAGEFLASLG